MYVFSPFTAFFCKGIFWQKQLHSSPQPPPPVPGLSVGASAPLGQISALHSLAPAAFPTEKKKKKTETPPQLVTFQMMHLVITAPLKKSREGRCRSTQRAENRVFFRGFAATLQGLYGWKLNRCFLSSSTWHIGRRTCPWCFGGAFPHPPSSIRSHQLTLWACHSCGTLAIWLTFSRVPPQPPIQLCTTSVHSCVPNNPDTRFPSLKGAEDPFLPLRVVEWEQPSLFPSFSLSFLKILGLLLPLIYHCVICHQC